MSEEKQKLERKDYALVIATEENPKLFYIDGEGNIVLRGKILATDKEVADVVLNHVRGEPLIKI